MFICTYKDVFICESWVTVSLSSAAAFVAGALALLGSPGPAIAALLALGRRGGMIASMRFYWGLQLGLATAAAICAIGLYSLVRTVPGIFDAMLIAAAAYLIWLAVGIAGAPTGSGAAPSNSSNSSAAAGFLLGMANPKAYIAFAALFTAYPAMTGPGFDLPLKWLLCVGVMVTVDFLWLYAGAVLRRTRMTPPLERGMNLAMGAAILLSIVPMFAS